MTSHPSSHKRNLTDTKSLPPLPLEVEGRRHQASGSRSIGIKRISLPQLMGLPGPMLHDDSVFFSSRWVGSSHDVDKERKNKPLPLEPEEGENTRGRSSYTTASQPFKYVNIMRSSGGERIGFTEPREPHHAISIGPPYSDARGYVGTASEKRLLVNLLGFDLMPLSLFDEAGLHGVKSCLAAQPHPDTVHQDVEYPIASCVWLREFIIATRSQLNFDRGRLRGLKLEDRRTVNVHRGFGLLWEFVEDCGKTGYHEKDKNHQLQWFQVSR